MSYEDPQGWNDVDYGGNPVVWDDVTSHRNTLFYPRLEMLRRAVIERYTCKFDPTSLSVLNTPITTNNTLVASSFLYDMDDVLFNVFLREPVNDVRGFVDSKATSDGSFDNEDDVPLIDRARMLELIGASSFIRITDAPNTMVLAEWIDQTYKILNELIWCLLNTSSTQITFGATTTYGRFGQSAVSWNDAVSDWNSDTWSVTGTSLISHFGRGATPTNYDVQREYVDTSVTNTTEFTPKLDYYGRFYKPNFVNSIYENPDYPINEDKVGSLLLDQDVAGKTTSAYDLGKIEAVTVTEPAVSNPPTYQGYFVDTTNPAPGTFFPLLRFDVDGGFKFIYDADSSS